MTRIPHLFKGRRGPHSPDVVEVDHSLDRRLWLGEVASSARQGTLGIRVVTITRSDSPCTLTDSYDLILVDCSSGDITITLPLAATYALKRWYIKLVNATRGRLTIQTQASSGTFELVDSDKEWVIDFKGTTMLLASDGVSAFNII